VNGPAAASACGPKKDERLEESNRRPESEKMILVMSLKRQVVCALFPFVHV
jgi:hypothetical protein